MENQYGSDRGDDRDQVNIYAGLDCAQGPDRYVPGNEAQGGGAKSKERQIQEVLWLRDLRKGNLEIRSRHKWDHEDNSVEKCPSGGEDRIIPQRTDLLGDGGVGCPYQRRRDRQEISHRV